MRQTYFRKAQASSSGFVLTELRREAAALKHRGLLFHLWRGGFSFSYGTHAQDWTPFKDHLRDGPLGLAILPPPLMVIPTIPTEPASGCGIFKAIGKLVQTIKNNPAYDNAMGEDLGLIGGEQTFDPQTDKPVLKLAIFNNNQPRVGWTKKNFQGVTIKVDRGGAGGWTFLATDSVPDYVDTMTMPVSPTTWKYRTVYRLGDVNVGERSDIAQITVGG